jgi:ribosomal protein S18 acetylase RimI-like enzyme
LPPRKKRTDSNTFKENDGAILKKPIYKELDLLELPETHAKVMIVCSETFFPTEFFEAFPESNKLIDMFALGVHHNYRRKGIAKELVAQSMQVGTYFHFSKGMATRR